MPRLGRVRKIFLKDFDTGEEKQLTRGNYDDIQPAWSPDGNSVLFVRSPDPGHKLEPGDVFGVYSSGNIWKRNLEEGEEALFLEAAFNPAYSPEGNRVAVGCLLGGPSPYLGRWIPRVAIPSR